MLIKSRDYSLVGEKDERLFLQTQAMANDHVSGGSYNMVAMWVKGGKRFVGYNRLTSPASLKSEIYPEICGVHAELDLWHRCKKIGVYPKGGTIYIAGSKSGVIMNNTMPCQYCAAILSEMKIRRVCYSYSKIKGTNKSVVVCKNMNYFLEKEHNI